MLNHQLMWLYQIFATMQHMLIITNILKSKLHCYYKVYKIL